MNENYIQLVIREFGRLKQLADGAVEQVSDGQFLAPSVGGDNSIAVIVKHMAGNMRSRWREFLTTDGEKPDRNRDMEFVLDKEDTRAHLTGEWEAGWQVLFDALEPLSETDFERVVTIRGEPLTVLQAINRQLSHYAYHVGQLVLIAKHFAGDQWQSLSVAKGRSAQFNDKPDRYIQ